MSGNYPCKVDYGFKSPRHPRIWMKACSLRANVEMDTHIRHCDGLHCIFFDDVDYFVVKIGCYIILHELQLHD
jgi:hypothetical protein